MVNFNMFSYSGSTNRQKSKFSNGFNHYATKIKYAQNWTFFKGLMSIISHDGKYTLKCYIQIVLNKIILYLLFT